ncbi:hypothetical protein Nepgr_021597 [Nepenthes gracilis]|uniref:non-specific serine/threonine protein kinase n=1 Tax=Nepenthes gracilis TaxID=150966 RepID=A0AAD3XXI8_NEPGR|nr:hypothetical protein Nepgr_021597 [Nepenthes gracilis]
MISGREQTSSLFPQAPEDQYNNCLTAEFKSEILSLSNIEHLDLVRAYEYIKPSDKRIIIMKFVSNGTLREHLDGTQGDGFELVVRLDITIDIAHTITYLHTYTDPSIIHRDIKASNIQLIDKLRAQLSKFGPARSHVYSFRVLLVELVTRKCPLEPNKGVKERFTTRWVMQKLKEGNPMIAMDLKR